MPSHAPLPVLPAPALQIALHQPPLLQPQAACREPPAARQPLAAPQQLLLPVAQAPSGRVWSQLTWGC